LAAFYLAPVVCSSECVCRGIFLLFVRALLLSHLFPSEGFLQEAAGSSSPRSGFPVGRAYWGLRMPCFPLPNSCIPLFFPLDWARNIMARRTGASTFSFHLLSVTCPRQLCGFLSSLGSAQNLSQDRFTASPQSYSAYCFFVRSPHSTSFGDSFLFVRVYASHDFQVVRRSFLLSRVPVVGLF